MLLQIDKDVRRLYPDISFFSQVGTNTIFFNIFDRTKISRYINIIYRIE